MWREGDEDKESSEEGVKLAVSLFIDENNEKIRENHSTSIKSWDILRKSGKEVSLFTAYSLFPPDSVDICLHFVQSCVKGSIASSCMFVPEVWVYRLQ
jgi:hypothetical protein